MESLIYIVFGCVFTHPVCLCMRHEIDVGVCQLMNVFFFGGRQNERKKEALDAAALVLVS